MKRCWRIWVFLCCLVPAVALGQPPSGAGNAGNEGWETVGGGTMVQPGESIPAVNLVGTAYGFIWAMVAGFVVSVWWRQRRLERDIDALRRRVEESARG